MTKVDAMPIYGENLNKADDLEICGIECSVTIKFLQMMTLGWPWPILPQGQIWSLKLLYGKTIDFSETIVVYDLKLATDDRSDKKFL